MKKTTLKSVFKGFTDKKSVEENNINTSVDTNKKFFGVEDIMKLTEQKKSKCYELIKQCNEELKEKGIIVINGKVPSNYFMERMGIC